MKSQYGIFLIVAGVILILLVFFVSNRAKNLPKESKELVEQSDLVISDNGGSAVDDKPNPNVIDDVLDTEADTHTSETLPEETVQPEENPRYTVTLKTTEGDITIQLNHGQTPNTVANFVKLSEEGFYDDTVFHRVIEGFMIQGGDPEGTGTGGPGYKFDDEIFEGEYTRGTVAMANSGPNTNGSQFFIMHQAYSLPKNYVIFGRVISGMDTVDKIATAEVKFSKLGEKSTPISPVKIVSIEVLAE
jgi:cyclophilin family peptidyl-prolyl cis-trans isomerase